MFKAMRNLVSQVDSLHARVDHVERVLTCDVNNMAWVYERNPPPKKTPSKPSASNSGVTTGTVTMRSDSEYSYQELSGDFGRSDTEIIKAGYATLAVTPVPRPLADLSRSLGRTYRMLLRALLYLSENPEKSIVIVAHTSQYADDLKKKLLSNASDVLDIEYAKSLQNRVKTMGSHEFVRLGFVLNIEVFIDHYRGDQNE
jgi:hypothetical protein